MTLLTKLVERFRTPGYRHAYAESFLDSFIATQIKALREQRQLSQTVLAEMASMRQSQISKLEDVNNNSWKISTLAKVARAFDLALVVRFESFGNLLPEVERFGRASLERPKFEDDPVFNPAAATEAPDSAGTRVHEITSVGSGKILIFPVREPVQLPFEASTHQAYYSGHVTAHAVYGEMTAHG